MNLRTSALLLFAALPVFAQFHAFVYAAPGGDGSLSGATHSDAFVHFGGGGEYVTKTGIGIGADAGVMGEIFGSTFGTFSLDGSYHFRRQRLVDPFLVGGYSRFFNRADQSFFGIVTPQPAFNLVNFGGGLNLWFSRHVGAKLQFRDHLHSENGATQHFAEFMMGLGFH